MFCFTRPVNIFRTSLTSLCTKSTTTTTDVCVPKQFYDDYEHTYMFHASETIKDGSFVTIGTSIGSAEKTKVAVDVCAPTSGIFRAKAKTMEFVKPEGKETPVWVVGSIEEKPALLEPDSAQAIFQQGIGYLTNQQLGHARATFSFLVANLSSASSSSPLLPYCLYNLGVVEIFSGNRSEAAKLFGKVLETSNPDKALLMHVGHARGVLRLLEGDLQIAKEYFQRTKEFIGASEFAFTIADLHLTTSDIPTLDPATAAEKRQQLQASFDRAVALDSSLKLLCLNVLCEWEQRLSLQQQQERTKPLAILLSNTAVLISPLTYDA
eukprot:PhF_6_TR26407/c0_g1_i2/m.38166